MASPDGQPDLGAVPIRYIEDGKISEKLLAPKPLANKATTAIPQTGGFESVGSAADYELPWN